MESWLCYLLVFFDECFVVVVTLLLGRLQRMLCRRETATSGRCLATSCLLLGHLCWMLCHREATTSGGCLATSCFLVSIGSLSGVYSSCSSHVLGWLFRFGGWSGVPFFLLESPSFLCGRYSAKLVGRLFGWSVFRFFSMFLVLCVLV